MLRTLLCVVAAFTGTAAFAQFDTGSFVGTVHDSSGAAVKGANVTVTNTATGIVSTTTTNENGNYEVPSLRVGSYKISATSTGFAESVADNVAISVGVRQRIDLTLKVGSQTTVEVSGVAIQIEADSSQRGQTITQYQSAALPLVTRNYSDLLGLVTGSRQAPTAATTTSINSLVRAGAYNINGQRSVFNNFLLDGMDNNAYGESNQGFDNQIIAVPPDSVAQFQIVTNNESAEYGRSSGATINTSSASGTNRYHATLYEFIRNTSLNATGFFKPTTGTTPFKKPTFNRNQFGGNFGGPIIKDKLFFFLDYEGFRQVLKPLSVLTLPTLNELNGNLVVPVRNPTTGQVYAQNTPIPAAAINPKSQQIINFFKQIPGLPQNGPVSNGGAASNDFAVQVPFTDNSDKGDLRFDYQQNPSSSWFLRISDRKETGINFPAIPIPLDGQTNGRIQVLDQQIALGHTHLFGSNKVLDARLGLSRTKAGKFSLSIGDNSITFPGLPTDPTVSGGLPSTSISGGFTSFGRQSTNPQWQNPGLVDPKVNFTWIKGRHSMKFGYEYEKIWMAVNDNNPLYGSFSFAGGFSVCPAGTPIPGSTTTCTGAAAVADNYWADFLFGNTNSYSLANFFVAHLRQSIQSVYAQDDYKVSPSLTLNLGLRWEYGSPYSEQKNFISNFDPASQTVLTITPGAVAGNGITPVSAGGVYGKTLVNPDLNDFAPRIGFAFAATPKTAIRGGYGVSYVHYTRAGSGNILAINAPQAQFAAVTQIAPTPASKCPTLPAQIIPIGGTAPSCFATIDQGFPSALVTAFNPATDNITYVPKNKRDSYVQSYFLSIQRELMKNTLLDIAYVGNRGAKLEGFLNANQKNPKVITNGQFTRPFGNWPSDITAAINGFDSHYDALQVRYEQRFVGGLTLLNSFSWSHALDNASASLEGNTPSPQDANNIRADYGQSDYNLPIANVTSLVYELPFGRGRQFLNHSGSALNTVVGGWQISGINTMQAGTPFNITYSPNSANAVSPQIASSFRGANLYRPNRVPGQPVVQKKQLSSGLIQYINLAAFSLPGTRDPNTTALLSPFGNTSRNPGRSPAFYETDLALNKKFNTPVESLKVEFRTEAYNLFNHTNLFLPSGALSGTLGGTPTNGGTVSSTFQPRIFQFGLKILY
ncbi:TonB-dependent receptor [Granulicella sp. dw_53]|uniref:TonB-dependent receptor n=1 Tax=Granulicella sp. dw_53 TaxID=2719792 RepID=UPI0031F6F6E1